MRRVFVFFFVLFVFSSCVSPEPSLTVTVSSSSLEKNVSEEFLEEDEEKVYEESDDDAELVKEEKEEIAEEEAVEESFSVVPQTYTEEEVIVVLEDLSEIYDVPLWFLKAIVHRESSFNASDVNMDDSARGDENWNSQKENCAFTSDGYPHGLGLTQLTGWMYQGSPYPYCLEEADNENKDYYYSMRKQDYGEWISMEDVSELYDPFNPRENVERFLTGYAVPAYRLFVSQYPEESDEEIWRRVAFHWNKGLYVEYDVENTDYLLLYDQYVEEYT